MQVSDILEENAYRMTDNELLIWISRHYEERKTNSYKKEQILDGNSLAQIVIDLMDDKYPNCIAVWYNHDSQKVTFVFANKEERGGQ